MRRVAVFGLGYVGCVTAACLSQDGHRVIGVDVDHSKVDEVNRGESPISEPGLEEILLTQVNLGRLTATTNVSQAVKETDIALIAVGTPSMDDGSVDVSGLERVLTSIGTALKLEEKKYCIVIRSTVLPGILESGLRPVLEGAIGTASNESLVLCNNPEFLREGTAVTDYYDPPYVLVGADSEEQASPVLELYQSINSEKIVTSTRTAALIKYASNAFHAAKIIFANEIGSLARSLGADGRRAMEIVCKDFKLNISPAYLRPGFAFGGSCLPKDLRAITRYAEQNALKTHMLSSILPSNESHIKFALKLIRETGKRKIGIVGLSFKSGTDDLRESPMIQLAESLIGWGYDVKIFDPNVMLSRLRGKNLAYVDRHLPHLANLLVPHYSSLTTSVELMVLCTDVANGIDLSEGFTGQILDLRKDLSRNVSRED